MNILVKLMSIGVLDSNVLQRLYRPGMKAPELRKALAEYESVWFREVDTVICRMSLSLDSQLYGFPLQALDILACRVSAASVLLGSLSTGKHSPFGPPVWSTGECIHWLLSDWWEEHGRSSSVDIFLSNPG
ncbi:hypothetical protein JIN85_06865 [Luteolibacter pohnpeiensis]|uniref:Uncharacterized protein n=1 Tax=Luteolibacter pohnpeiensis TaxID=454153 RepID=A0A934VU43_9BACT|nr:hypothetical protein [Luteolibacter pohnpeiensis]MBK1882127.1 hypothetical protein [Luteolibacter pohnpeiensis]